MVPLSNNEQQARRTLLRVAIGAGGSGLVVGLVVGSFSSAGIVDMTVSSVMLAVAWIVGILSIAVSEPVWRLSIPFRVISVVFSGIVLGCVLSSIGIYQYVHLPVPDKGHAELQFVTASPIKDPTTGNSFINLQVNNIGTLSALHMVDVAVGELSDRVLTKSETDTMMSSLYNRLNDADKLAPINNNVQHASGFVVSLSKSLRDSTGFTVTDQQLVEINNYRQLLYVFFLARYEDEITSGSSYWNLQLCGYFSLTTAFWHNCAPYQNDKVVGRRFK
jgi:hypothetical protein